MTRELKPKLRFPSFDHEWKTTKLKHVSNYQKGFAFKSEDYRQSGARIIRVSDLSADSIKLDNEKIYIDQENASKHGRYVINSGEVIITTVGSKPHLKESAVGRAIFVEKSEEHLLNQNLLKLEFDDENVSNFIFRYLNSPRYIDYITSIQRGNANQSNIAVKDLLEYPLSTTSKEEQQKIADFLSSVDKKINLLKEKHVLLTQYKKGVMQKLIKQEIRFKNDNGNDFPGWQTIPLSKLASKNSVKNKDESVNAVLTNSAKDGIVNQGDYFKKDIANQQNLGGYTVVEKNDFVYNPRISELAPVGPIKRNHIGQGVMSPLYTVFRFKDDSLLDYLELYFNTTMWHRYMHSIANFGARHDRMNVTTSDFYALPLPIPSEEERAKIVSFVNALEAKVNAVKRQVEMTQTFKKGLLQQMFV